MYNVKEEGSNEMKRIFLILIVFLTITGCKNVAETNKNINETINYVPSDVFIQYNPEETVLALEGDNIKLSDYVKNEDLIYTCILENDEGIEISSLEASMNNEIPLLSKGKYVLNISAKDVNDLNTTINIQVDSLEDVLADLDKDEDINVLLEKYGASLSSDIDTSKPGIYSVEVKRNDDTVEYVAAVVAKDEIGNDAVIESKPSVPVKEDTSKPFSSSSLDKSDERIALAYEYEGRGGLCGQIAYNYLKDLGYLNNFTFEDFLMYQVLDKFEHVSDPVPFKTLIEYDNGNHVAVYLGNNMALHGNYTGDYANGNGKAKVASMYISGMNITSYKNMDVANTYAQEELIKEATGPNNATNQPTDNSADWKDDCYAINESGEGICEISENGDLNIELYDYPNVFNDDNPMTESSYDSSLCNNKFSAIDAMSKGQYPQLNEFCAIYYPDYVEWDN